MFSFLPFQENHLSLFRSWLQQAHVKKFWQEPEGEKELHEKFLKTLPARGIHCFIIETTETKTETRTQTKSLTKTETGFIQYYEAIKVGGGWWEHENPGTYGIDLMIGSPDHIGIGLGPQVIAEFIAYVRKLEPNLKSVIIDPDPHNRSAIRAFEKAGFTQEKEITTPGGPALLMRISYS